MTKKPQYPSDKADQFMIRFPEGMRERIKSAAQRSGRSMNAEIVAALETFYPEEPSIEEVIDRVHDAIERAQTADRVPYRKVLLDALDQLSVQLTAGMELDQFRAPHVGPEYQSAGRFGDRYRRWRRVQEHGVETEDFERELKRGMFSSLSGDRVRQILNWFAAGRDDFVLRNLHLSETNFVDKTAVVAALRNHFIQYYKDNWGDEEDDLSEADEEPEL